MRKSQSTLVRSLIAVIYRSRERELTTTRKEAPIMLMRTDPFRELDRLTQQVLGTAARPAAMPMDA